MIAVALNKRPDVLLVPVRKNEMKVELRFSLEPGIKNFIQHEESHSVGQLQQFWRRRIVGGADGIAAHLAQEVQLTLRRALIERRSERAEIMMIVDTLKADTLAVDIQSIRLALHCA